MELYPVFTATTDKTAPWVAVPNGFVTLQTAPGTYPLLFSTPTHERIEVAQVTPALYTVSIDGIPVSGPAHPVHVLQTIFFLTTTAPVLAWKEGIHRPYLDRSYCWILEYEQTTYVIGRCTGYTRALLQMYQFTIDVRVGTWQLAHGIASSFVILDTRLLPIHEFFATTRAVIRQTPLLTL